jgi:hypothetical protein
LSGWALLTSAFLAMGFGVIVFFRIMLKFNQLCDGNVEERLKDMK